ncbi:MAG: TIR domain-containing protein [Candidatus Aminicenantes bacterium]|nr:TIR domain-containing protein [Candidatus Aminicenantes bacterium]NIM84629.1 TIR domain-containing protein [Candidatus Aminicenantes bacterium]NIN21443.1 TIR domain-containing protein [Candidatus Aminicenantes bacterium]NIN47858.1 TIR domain-containing protein [Candidatus Aminicenantes bacterium]NIN90796.1 TIR domain-containing protein [Candidatus Aminicenantes bacterium]
MPSEKYLREIKKRIKEAGEKQLKELDLSGMPFIYDGKLTQIPEEVFELEHLEVLDLSNNQLTTVPGSIAKLRKLTRLKLFDNQLTFVPESIAKLQNLKKLVLKGNPIETPPPEVVFDKEGETDLKGIKNYFRQLEKAEKNSLHVLIACNCSVCKGRKEPHFYRLENLKKRLRDRQFQVQCDESYEYVEILSLVDDFLEKDLDIGEGEDLVHPYADSREKRETEPVKEIYISYAWGGESEEIANRLDEAFREKGIPIIRDKLDLGFKGRINEFMERIGRGKCVIVVISNKYLESRNCMFELMQIAKSGDFYGRIFPVVLDDAKIYDPEERIKYVQYWEKKKKALDDEMKSVSSEYLDGFREDIDLYADIRKYLPRLTDILRDMNTLTVEIHSQTGFEELVKAAAAKLEE